MEQVSSRSCFPAGVAVRMIFIHFCVVTAVTFSCEEFILFNVIFTAVRRMKTALQQIKYALVEVTREMFDDAFGRFNVDRVNVETSEISTLMSILFLMRRFLQNNHN